MTVTMPRPPEQISSRVLMWMAIVAVVTSMGASAVAAAAIVRVGKQAETAQRLSYDSCVRTIKFSPSLAVAYEKYEILSDDELEVYLETIPKTCKP